MEMKEMLKDIGKRISNIGSLVDTNPDNDPVEEYSDKNIKDIGKLKDAFNSKDAAAVSDKNLKDIDKTSNTADIIEKAYKQLDDIIYKYNSKGQSLGEDDKLRAGVTAQSLQGSILESNVFTDPESGFLKIDTAQLALSNAAAIKEIFERLDKLEGKK